MKSYKLAVGLFTLFLVLIGLWLGNAIRFPIALTPAKGPQLSHEAPALLEKSQSYKSKFSVNSGSTVVPTPNSRPRLLKAGGLALPVQFQDFTKTHLSDSQCAEVIQDLQRIYGHFEQYETYNMGKFFLPLDC